MEPTIEASPEYGRFLPAPNPDDPERFQEGTYVSLKGARFRVSEQVGLMALMDYAEIAEQGVDSDAVAGLAAMKRLLKELIDARDWKRFHTWTLTERITGDELGLIIGQAMAIADAQSRPTGSPSGSAGGAPTTGQSSNGTSGGAGSPDDAWTARKRALGITPIEADLGSDQ
jgi:hypothetical protein